LHFSGYIRRPQKTHVIQINWFKIVESKLSNNFKNLWFGFQRVIDKIFEVVEVKVEELDIKVESCCDCNICNYDYKWFNIDSELFW